MGAKPLKQCTFSRDGVKHWARIQRTGDTMPQPARIVVTKEYWSDVGGWKGWDSAAVLDRKFDDWRLAYATYDEIWRSADAGSVVHS